MSVIFRGIFYASLSCLFGGLVGSILGAWWGLPSLGPVVGACLAVTFYATCQAMRAQHFVAWLRDTSHPAPRSSGLWGELGYRVERSVRSLERLIVQEKLQRAQFLSGIEASPNGVMLLDRQHQIEWCNLAAASHFGLQRDIDRRQSVTNLIRSPVFVAYLQGDQFEAPVYLGGPGSRQRLMVLVRCYGEGMKLVLSQDVTERERIDAMRRDFVANVSHEIRTPLTVLSGFIETLSDIPLTEKDRRHVIELMAQQTVRMQGLVSDLLALAQLEGSPPPPHGGWVSAAALMQHGQADALALSAGRHMLSFTGECDFELAGAETELHSALTNLVSNAVRYTPAGGRIEIRFRCRSDGAAELEVQDSGLGIEKDHIPRLTERFYRVDGSRSRETGGTGLGLSIVKHVVQRHDGELEIVSEPGHGSTFRLVFPAMRVRRTPVHNGQQVQVQGQQQAASQAFSSGHGQNDA